jgi:hypothetical protein
MYASLRRPSAPCPHMFEALRFDAESAKAFAEETP